VRDVSLEQIAQEAGIGRSTLYQYYPSKPDLLFDLMEQSLRATDRVYQKLAQIERIDARSVSLWLVAYLTGARPCEFRRHVPSRTCAGRAGA